MAERKQTTRRPLTRAPVHDDEVMLNRGDLWEHAYCRCIRSPVRCERHPTPRVERTMVIRFTHHVEDKVLLNYVPAPHPVVEINPCPWSIVANVLSHHVVARDCLMVARDLLTVDTDVVNVVPLNQVVTREATRALVRGIG